MLAETLAQKIKKAYHIELAFLDNHQGQQNAQLIEQVIEQRDLKNLEDSLPSEIDVSLDLIPRPDKKEHHYHLLYQGQDGKKISLPIAIVYSCASSDYQARLLDAILLNLKITPQNKLRKITLPSGLKDHVAPQHLELIGSWGDYPEFKDLPYIFHIFNDGPKKACRLMESFSLNPQKEN